MPKQVDKKYFNHIKGAPVNERSKVARFEQPMIAVRHVQGDPRSDKKAYTLTHCSFQSTGGTNISSVDALSEIIRERNMGRGSDKRTCAIKMNQPPDAYLKMYSAVDKIY